MIGLDSTLFVWIAARWSGFLEVGVILSLEVGLLLSLGVLSLEVRLLLSLGAWSLEVGLLLSLIVRLLLSLVVGFVTVRGVGLRAGFALVVIIVAAVAVAIIIMAVPIIIPVAAAMCVGGPAVAGGTMGNTGNVSRMTVFQIAIAASVIIIVYAAIDIKRFSVSNDVAWFINRTAFNVAWSIIRATRVSRAGIGVRNTTAHQGCKSQER